jgi:hypothetical protein
MDWFANGLTTQVVTMSRFEQQHVHEHEDELGPFSRELTHQDDLTMEQILENLNHTPLGQVLKRIASMPEVRRKKVLEVRRSLSKGLYELNGRLDRVLERVFEDLKA